MLLEFLPTEDRTFKLNQTVRLKASEPDEVCGIIKWTSPNGVIVGVEFETENLDSFAGIKPYCSTFIECKIPNSARILLSEDLALLPKIIPTPTEQSGVLKTIFNSLLTHGFVSGDGKNRKSKKRNKNKSLAKKKVDKNHNEIIPEVQKIVLKIPESIPPPKTSRISTESGRGIVWQSNSCYLDATLFAMFFATDIFDEALLSDKYKKAIQNPNNQNLNGILSGEVRAILRNEIVYPLRVNLSCSPVSTSKLRTALAPLNHKIQSSFMDAEDFIFILLERSLNLKEFLTYNNGVSDFMHQIFVDNSDPRRIGFVQDLLETSMRLTEDVKFDGIPKPALLLEMPRSSGSLVHYRAIVPNLSIDMSNILGERFCICGEIGKWFCPQCEEQVLRTGQQKCCWTFFCEKEKDHHIANHADHELVDAKMFTGKLLVEMDLLAVICIRSMHYTAIVKCGEERGSPWLFFDSMDKVKRIYKLGEWLQKLEDNPENVENILKQGPPELRRIVFDCHICIYRPFA